MSSEEKLEAFTETVLRELGIADGHHILDCCCGSGVYTVSAARLVGDSGLVYAIDRDNIKLNDLRKRAETTGLKNIKIVEEDAALQISLPDATIEFVLLYDIFWYFRPKEKKIRNLLKEVRRVAKPNACISVYPTHVDSNSLEYFKSSMHNRGFILVSEYTRELVHEKTIERGTLLNFRKASNNRVRRLEDRIADLKNRIPVHSIPPSMIQELEDLEEELESIKRHKN